MDTLSNEARKRGKNEKPKLTDFRETGAIGDVANFAGILWRPQGEPEEEAAGENGLDSHELRAHGDGDGFQQWRQNIQGHLAPVVTEKTWH